MQKQQRIRITISGGVVTNGREQLKGMMSALPDGEYIMSSPVSLSDPHTVEEWRHLYFHLRDVLHMGVETGYTKQGLHDEIKMKILPDMMEQGNIEWFVNEEVPDEVSTKYLSAVGWKEYFSRFKEFSMDMFDVYI